MKKILLAAALLIGCGAITPVAAQEESTVKKVGEDIKKGAKKAGHKSAEAASKGKAKATDEVYKGKVGPGGQTIYIDNHSRYYWVNDKGKRNYVLEQELKEKLN